MLPAVNNFHYLHKPHFMMYIWLSSVYNWCYKLFFHIKFLLDFSLVSVMPVVIVWRKEKLQNELWMETSVLRENPLVWAGLAHYMCEHHTWESHRLAYMQEGCVSKHIKCSFLLHLIKCHVDSTIKSSNLYSGDSQFQSQPEHQLWMRLSMDLSIPPFKCHVITLK